MKPSPRQEPPGTWWPSIYKCKLQLDDEPNLYIKKWPFPSIYIKLVVREFQVLVDHVLRKLGQRQRWSVAGRHIEPVLGTKKRALWSIIYLWLYSHKTDTISIHLHNQQKISTAWFYEVHAPIWCKLVPNHQTAHGPTCHQMSNSNKNQLAIADREFTISSEVVWKQRRTGHGGWQAPKNEPMKQETKTRCINVTQSGWFKHLQQYSISWWPRALNNQFYMDGICWFPPIFSM